MQHFLTNATARLTAVNSQIDSIQSRLSLPRSYDRTRSVGPVERLVLEIELAELRLEHASLVSKLPM